MSMTLTPAVQVARQAEALAVAEAYEHCRNRARDEVLTLMANCPHSAELRAAERHLAAAELQLAEACWQWGSMP